MKRVRTGVPAILSLLTIAVTAGCGAEDPATDPGNDAPKTQSLLGTATIDEQSCPPHDKKYLERVMRWGRTIAKSPAFTQCVDRAMREGVDGIGPYMPCQGDPFHGESIDVQVRRVLDVVQSPNDVSMECNVGGGEIASAYIGSYGHADTEAFRWSPRLVETFDTYLYPLCRPGERPHLSPCRWAPEPWPWAPLAGTVWHEAMHTHGYLHGAGSGDDPDPAAIECGYAPGSAFHFQRNTVPYLVGSCLEHVAALSVQHCGAPLESSRSRRLGNLPLKVVGLNLIDNLDARTCRWTTDESLWLATREAAVTTEPDTDRYGQDYRAFHLAPHVDHRACADACSSDYPRCKAFTYAPGGFQGDDPMCWLKSEPGVAEHAPGLVSGVSSR